MFKDSDPLIPFFEATQKVFTAHFGDDLSATLVIEIRQACETLRSAIAYIGGKGNMKRNFWVPIKKRMAT